LGVIARQTRDVDILDPVSPPEVALAAREFAAHLRARGVELGDDWINNGPLPVAEALPVGWRLRLRPAFAGTA
jgi:hypothetical protein